MTFYNVAVAFVIMLLLGGCTSWGSSPLWPSLNDGASISASPGSAKPSETRTSVAQEEAQCLKGGAEVAENCALNTIDELNEMLDSTSRYKRGAAYALVAAGGAAGGAIAFDASRDLIMGLALGVASVLGLDAVVNPDGQTAVLRAGLQAMRCLYGTAVAAREVGRETGLQINQLLSSDTVRNLGVVSNQFDGIDTRIKEAGLVPANDQLGPAVVAIRGLVREGLYDTIPALESLAQAQRTRSDAMVDAFRRNLKDEEQQARLQLNSGAVSLPDERDRFVAIATATTLEAKTETALERLRSRAQEACST